MEAAETLTHLQYLESESIHILREAVSESDARRGSQRRAASDRFRREAKIAARSIIRIS